MGTQAGRQAGSKAGGPARAPPGLFRRRGSNLLGRASVSASGTELYGVWAAHTDKRALSQQLNTPTPALAPERGKTYLDVLARIDQVLEQRVLAPHDAAVLVRRRVGEALGLPGLAAEEAVQVRALLVAGALRGRAAAERAGRTKARMGRC